MKKAFSILFFLIMSTIGIQGCNLDLTSFLAPDTATTGSVITLSLEGFSTNNNEGAKEHGVVLQIPSNWQVISGWSEKPTVSLIQENASYESLFTLEPGYKIWVGTSSAQPLVSSGQTVETAVKLRVLTGSNPGNYNIKTAVGAFVEGEGFVTDDPPAMTNFVNITSEPYVETIDITDGGIDTIAPDSISGLTALNLGTSIQMQEKMSPSAHLPLAELGYW